MKAMLSIKPQYVSKIVDGTKKYEFRRRIFCRNDVESILIYETRPTSAVVAEARVGEVLCADPKSVWQKCGACGGISKQSFMRYFKGTDIAYAIELRDVNAFDTPTPVSSYSPYVNRAPQSFAYVG